MSLEQLREKLKQQQQRVNPFDEGRGLDRQFVGRAIKLLKNVRTGLEMVENPSQSLTLETPIIRLGWLTIG